MCFNGSTGLTVSDYVSDNHYNQHCQKQLSNLFISHTHTDAPLVCSCSDVLFKTQMCSSSYVLFLPTMPCSLRMLPSASLIGH